MARRRGRKSGAKDKEKDKDKEITASQGSQTQGEKDTDRGERTRSREDRAERRERSRGDRGDRRRRGRKEKKVYPRKEPVAIDNVNKVARQLDFYFSDANLRRDRFMKKTVDEGDGAVALETLLTFNRIKALGVIEASQLVEAVRCSGMLELAGEGTKVRRDFQKHPIGSYDPVSRTLYVEGLPLTFNVDEVTKFFKQHGQVKLVEIPQHRETREPRGFAFVEFGSTEAAEKALKACDGRWPGGWPQRFDGKTLRIMWKAQWHEQCREYKQLQSTSRGPSFLGRPKDDVHSPRVVPAVAVALGLTPEADPPEAQPAAAEAAKVDKPKPAGKPGCLVKLSGFSGEDELVCSLAIRQFAEHAVTVEYCDYVPSASTAHLRLKCPEDTATLLEDMKLTGRLLGCQQPTGQVLNREEEEQYWQSVVERAQQRGPKEATVKDAKQTAKRREPENVVTRIRRWRPASSTGGPFRAGFMDTAGGSTNFVAAGFGRTVKRTPKVIPPRKREEETGGAAASGPAKGRKKEEKGPLLPPASPFQLPGTTRKRRRGSALPPPSPAALPPPSPCGLDESMSPESDDPVVNTGASAASSSRPANLEGAPELADLEEEFDPDEIVSMMEGFG